jgi:organic hydroperoxide reductase OsmC/OhrA
MKNHHYNIKVEWTGNKGEGTLNYQSYRRDHTVFGEGKYNPIQGSSDPSFLGDRSKYNPEDLFLSSLAACHMLWYLHLCTANNIIVTGYTDKATGIMTESSNGSGKFTSVTLQPVVIVQDEKHLAKANSLHEEANKMCFIANSCNFQIAHHPTALAK